MLTRSEHTGLAVAHEDVGHSVDVARCEVRGVTGEGHEATVRAEIEERWRCCCLGAAASDARALGRVGQKVADEHVGRGVGVAGDEVGGRQLWNATKRPSAESQASKLTLLPCAPALLTLSRVVVA